MIPVHVENRRLTNAYTDMIQVPLSPEREYAACNTIFTGFNLSSGGGLIYAVHRWQFYYTFEKKPINTRSNRIG
ncbi:hypothetical protein Bresa_01109|uniref:Uncharacterized protein n=1 Tax=Brenneria salicis ATCC 15712 = DSM 30166 TaxID=714314 RepID=A0A366I961_9GAMM|nr:hypothetical protein [Brenneria salicis ATCC 15712 = DSM 30166]RBP66481.1 hypothetical protein DES54_1038 [Brenneria salicis ATCC 15712 = DSM 30166]